MIAAATLTGSFTAASASRASHHACVCIGRRRNPLSATTTTTITVIPRRNRFFSTTTSTMMMAARAPRQPQLPAVRRRLSTTMTRPPPPSRYHALSSSRSSRRRPLPRKPPAPSSSSSSSGAGAMPPPPSTSPWQQLIQRLESILLRPRATPLPRWISPRQSSFTLSEFFGHGSFILVAASYATDDFLHLRMIAVAGSASMLFFTYFHPHGRVLWLPLRWNVLFIVLNSYRIGRVLWDRWQADHLPQGMKKFREDHLYVMDPVDFKKLIAVAEEETFAEGDLVVQQGAMNRFIRIVVEGELEVRRDGTLTYLLEEGMFVSEGGLHAGLMLTGAVESCATIIAGRKSHRVSEEEEKGDGEQARNEKKIVVRALRWDRNELIDLLESDRGICSELKAALSWDIVRKLKSQRDMINDPGLIQNAAAWTKKRQEQGISRYASILQNLVDNPDTHEKKHLSEILTKYRTIHRIGDSQHLRALAKCRLTEEEFAAGKRNVMSVQDLLDYDEEDEEDEESVLEKLNRARVYSKKIVKRMTKTRA